MKPASRAIGWASLTAIAFTACTRSDIDVPESNTAIVSESPAAIYALALPELRERVNPGTEVVRIDEPEELAAMTLRFSVSASDRSVRLIEVHLTPRDATTTSARVRSRKFTFLRPAARDAIDLEVENQMLALLEHNSGK